MLGPTWSPKNTGGVLQRYNSVLWVQKKFNKLLRQSPYKTTFSSEIYHQVIFMYQTISNLPGLVSVHCKSRSPQEFNGLWKVCNSAPFQFCFPRVLNNFQAFQNSGDVEDAAHWSKKKDKIKRIDWCRRQRKMKGKKRKKEQNIWKSGNRPGTPSFWAKFLVWKTSSTDCTPSDATCWFEKSWRILRQKINVVVAMDLAVELLGAQLL